MKTPVDAIALLIKRSQGVKEMFEQYETLTDRSQVSKKKVADQICRTLTVHTQAEQEIFYPAVRAAIKDNALMD